MIDILALNAVLFLFMLLSIVWQRPQLKLKTVSHTNQKINPYILILFSIGWISFLLYLIINGSYLVKNAYITANFLILVLMNSFWVTTNKSLHLKIGILIVSIALYVAALFTRSPFIHNLVMFASVLWVGPFLTRINLLNRKRFLIISALWFLYDIIFVWVTPLHSQVSLGTEETIFTLGITVGNYFLGAGDLLYANLLLSILRDVRAQLIASVVLVVSTIFLVWLGLSTQIVLAFPLLVLWVPLAVGLMITLSPTSYK